MLTWASSFVGAPLLGDISLPRLGWKAKLSLPKVPNDILAVLSELLSKIIRLNHQLGYRWRQFPTVADTLRRPPPPARPLVYVLVIPAELESSIAGVWPCRPRYAASRYTIQSYHSPCSVAERIDL